MTATVLCPELLDELFSEAEDGSALFIDDDGDANWLRVGVTTPSQPGRGYCITTHSGIVGTPLCNSDRNPTDEELSLLGFTTPASKPHWVTVTDASQVKPGDSVRIIKGEAIPPGVCTVREVASGDIWFEETSYPIWVRPRWFEFEVLQEESDSELLVPQECVCESCEADQPEEPTQEQLDALYDEGYAKGYAEAETLYVDALKALGLHHIVEAVFASATAASLAYWESRGEPRRRQPKRTDLTAWVRAVCAGANI